MAIRVMAYDGRSFPDPDPTLSIDEVKKNFANFFPEIATAEVREHKPEKDGDPITYEFIRKTGVKGATPKPWVMPDWMEKYRPLLFSGNSTEELMNDHNTRMGIHRVMIIHRVKAQIELLENLKLQGLLRKETV